MHGNPKEYVQKNSQFQNSLALILISSDDAQFKTFNFSSFLCLLKCGGRS